MNKEIYDKRNEPVVEPPKELYEKFDEFLALLLEVNKVRDTLYNVISQRVGATLDMMGEDKGIAIRDEFTDVWVSLRFDETDFDKVMERCITYRWRHDMAKYTERAVMLLSGWCEELRAALVPEPEVLITTETPKGKVYKLSAEWMKWFHRALPNFPPDAPWEMAGLRAAQKHFQRGPADRIERVPNQLSMSNACYGVGDLDLEIEFYRVTREKL